MRTPSVPCEFLEHPAVDLDAEDQDLLHSAQDAATQAYAPYSRFHVGAALRTTDGASGDREQPGERLLSRGYLCGTHRAARGHGSTTRWPWWM